MRIKNLNHLGNQMNKDDLADLQEFFKMFDVRIDGDTVLSRWKLNPFEELNPSATFTTEKHPAYQLTVSIKQLQRLVNILKSKGYYHDDAYQIKMHEEELILSNPQLKYLHDQYKTYLYMLNDRPYDQDNLLN